MIGLLTPTLPAFLIDATVFFLLALFYFFYQLKLVQLQIY